MGTSYNIPSLPLNFDIESKDILRQVNRANRALAELKGIAATMPNETMVNQLYNVYPKEPKRVHILETCTRKKY